MSIASQLQLPPGDWLTVLDCLCARFPRIDRGVWIDRMRRGRVLDGNSAALAEDAPYRCGLQVRYFREVAHEPQIPFVESIVHADADLVVADKSHFLPVMPAGNYVAETLLARLIRQLDNPDLVPLHRIDRGTAGLVLFSARPATRRSYQDLFRLRRIVKTYEAIAPALPRCTFPLTRASRIAIGEPFFRMREVDGASNAESRIDVLERGEHWWRYALFPHSGRKHQLRLHMAALGAPIVNDDFYPQLAENAGQDWSRPLQLLARSLQFVDPISGDIRHFHSRLQLSHPINARSG